jgi:hypothetical protein
MSLFFFSVLHIGRSQEELSLDGKWEIVFDENNEGRDADWMNADIFEKLAEKRDIKVPSAWELIKQDYEGVAFYKKTFDVPVGWEGRIIRLQFGAVNYLSEVWLNNEVVGYHEGGFTPFEFRVDEMIRAGETNVLTIRVVGPIILTDKKVDGIGKMETPQWRGGLTGGIWQEVKLVSSGDIYIDDVYIQPDIYNNTATFHIELDHTASTKKSVSISLSILESKYSSKKVATIEESWSLHPGKNKKKWTLRIPEAKYWSPEDPHLYIAKVSVDIEGETSDAWDERFGMRELTIKDRDFYLNSQRIFIKASFFEGLYPNGIAYPDNEEMARKEIQLAKDAGFNMIRPWRRPPVPMWLDLADEMGVLVVGSPVLECMTLPLSTPYLPERVENEVRRSILRDRNHACIVQWELFNELHRPVLKQLMRPMAMLARSLDPTRLILDESGGWAYGANMYLPNDFEPTKFNDIHNYPGPFINTFHYEGYLSIGLTEEEKKEKGYDGSKVGRNVVPGLMSYVSELGYGSLPEMGKNITLFEDKGNPLTPAYRYYKRLDEGQQQVIEQSGFKNLYPEMNQFYLDQQSIHGAANKRMIEAVRANPEVDGYCIHALIAGDWIMGAGLIDLWRNPKTAVYESTKAANQPRIFTIRMHPRNVYADKGAKLEIIGINDLEKTGGKFKVEILNRKGKVIYKNEMYKEWTQGVSSMLNTSLKTNSWEGEHKVRVRMEADDGTEITNNEYLFDVFKAKSLLYPRGGVALMSKESKLSPYLKYKRVEVEEFTPSTRTKTPVLVTRESIANKMDSSKFVQLYEFIKKGGTAIYLGGVPNSIESGHYAYPFTATVHPARGLWTCIPHLVHQHPIFIGLPVNGMMKDVYENVWATNTLRDLIIDGEVIPESVVGSIGFDWFSSGHKMHYSGPGEAWWGSDVAIIPFGKGKIIMSQLRLMENLTKDPVADKILANIIRYATNK